jgi:hypothetical protein
MIWFSDDVLSMNGKKIPLSAFDGNPHICAGKEFGTKTIWG